MDLKGLKEQLRALCDDQVKSLGDDRAYSEKAEEIQNRETDIKSVTSQIEHWELATGPDLSGAADAKVEPEAEKKAVAGTIGEQFIGSKEFGSARKGARFSTGQVELKAVDDYLGEVNSGGGGAGLVWPDERPSQVVGMLFRRLLVRQLFSQGTVNSSSIMYPKESSVTNSAAAVSEGGAKPASELNLTQVTESVRKIATTLKVSDEMLEDVAAIRSYVDGRLQLFVRLTEEDQLLNGNGTAPNLTGLLNRAGLQDAVTANGETSPVSSVDAIYTQMTNIRTDSFLEPDAVIIHPSDWKDIRLSKDGNDQYYGGGPFGGAYGNGGFAGDSLWGLPVVITPAVSSGTAVVGAFRAGGQVLQRSGLTVEATNSNEDDFINNLVAIRAEERLALAVYRPGAFGTVTGL